jgi:hypothetical protein
MCALIEVNSTSALGPWVRYSRLYLRKTRKEIARLAKVHIKDIVHLENNGPLSGEIRTRILKELYRIRVRNWDMLTDC